jgi:hypothetical protein
MRILSIVAGLIIILAVLLDAFETVVLPRRVRRFFRLSAAFYGITWIPWKWVTARIQTQARRESFLGYFGPLSLLFLLVLWAAGLVIGFALLQYGGGRHVQMGSNVITFGVLLYHSGETFFTLGYGDITPDSGLSRALSVLEAGMGFAFLGVVIGYLPTIYGAFSRREIEISLLDARAGSPPTASELLRRYGSCPQQDVLDQIFRDWEHWSAEVLESHISYPVLSYYRSQHNNQSWLGALTTILDATAIVITGVEGIRNEQARVTFAMARHAVVDLAQVIHAHYDPTVPSRLAPEETELLRKTLSERGLRLREGPEAEHKLAHLRGLYEPYVQGMAERLFISLPPWFFAEKKRDNWEAGPWDRLIQAQGLRRIGRHMPGIEDHF